MRKETPNETQRLSDLGEYHTANTEHNTHHTANHWQYTHNTEHGDRHEFGAQSRQQQPSVFTSNVISIVVPFIVRASLGVFRRNLPLPEISCGLYRGAHEATQHKDRTIFFVYLLKIWGLGIVREIWSI